MTTLLYDIARCPGVPNQPDEPPRLARRLRNLPAPHRAGQSAGPGVDGAASHHRLFL